MGLRPLSSSHTQRSRSGNVALEVVTASRYETDALLDHRVAPKNNYGVALLEFKQFFSFLLLNFLVVRRRVAPA